MPLIQEITTATGGTNFVPLTRTLSINGVTYDLSADRSWTISTSGVGTVTSVALASTMPTGLTASISGSPITSSGTLNLNVSFASGYSIPTNAKQTEWDSAYTNRITSLTTTGASGASTLIGNTLNVPEYTLAGLGGFSNPMTSLGDIIYGNAVGLALRRAGNITTTKMFLSQTGDGSVSAAPSWSTVTAADTGAVPTSRTITINGTSFDLSANRTYSVGTVTSVAALTIGTTGTDITSSVANGTTTPVITLNIPSASASNRGALSSTDWTTFNSKQATITLTTTGSSGAASLVSNTLNIPNYTLSGLGGISGSGTTGYIPKFTGSDTIGNSIIQESTGFITVYGNGQLYKQQAGAGITQISVENRDTTAGKTSSTILSTQHLGSGVSRSFIQAASYTAGNLTRGEFGILTENGAQFVANFGTQMSGGENTLSIYSTSAYEGVRLNTGGTSWLMGGNVGIDTQIPAYKLDVNGTIRAVLNTTYSSEDGPLMAVSASTPAKRISLGYDNTNDFAFISALHSGVAWKKLIIQGGGGNVAIGHTTAAEQLDVLGNIKLSGYITGGSWQGTAITPAYGGTGATTLTGVVIGNGTSTMTAVAGTANQLLRRNSSNTAYEFFTSSFVDTSRTITINGTTQDLSANRTYNVGTVTSVNASVPTGFAVGSAVTSSGNIAISFATGYALPTTASQTTWDAAYNDKINSASVTGTTTKTLTLNQQDGGTITASWTDINTDAVTSVFGRTGAVVATSGDYTTTLVTEGTNLYYTEARVNANTNVAANTAARHNAVTLGTANGLSLSTQVLSLGLASSGATGALSSTDWTTFNNKQNALTNPVTGNGAGAIGYFPKFSGVNAIENSNFFESGTGLYYGGGSASEYSLQIGHNRTGNGYAYLDLIGDATHTDYGMRLIRGNTGANTTSTIEHRGTGDFILKSVDTGTFKVQVASTDVLSIISTGLVTFTNNARFSVNNGCTFVQSGGTLLGSIYMDSFNNRLIINNNATNSLSIGESDSFAQSNFGIGHGGNVFGSGTKTISVNNGTAPSSSASSSFLMYSQNISTGNAAPHFRTENGAVIKLYQETTSVGNAIFSAGGGTSVLDDSTFDGYTLRQIVKALRNQGILA